MVDVKHLIYERILVWPDLARCRFAEEVKLVEIILFSDFFRLLKDFFIVPGQIGLYGVTLWILDVLLKHNFCDVIERFVLQMF